MPNPSRPVPGCLRRRPPLSVLAALSLFGSTLLCLRTGTVPAGLVLAALGAAGLAAAALAGGVLTAAPQPALSGSLSHRRGFAALALLCLALGAGMGPARLWPMLQRRGLQPTGLPLSQVGRYEAQLIRDSSATPGEATRYELRLTRVLTAGSDRCASSSATVVLWIEEGPRLAAGRLVEVEGRLRPPSAGGLPALSSRAPREALTVKGYRNLPSALRASLLEAVRRRLGGLDAPTAATLEALVLGSREEVSTELYDGFRASGSLHLLALSGLHAGILYLLVSCLLRFARPPAVRRLAAAAVLVLYLLLAGFRPSLFRAVVMILAAVLGGLLDRDARPLNLLALAAAALILVDPAAVLTLSFQLSFLAVAGILVLSPGLQRWLERVLPRVAAAALAYSLAAQAATAPLLLVRFGVLYPVGIIAALPLIPLVSIFIWFGLGYLALAGTAVGGPAGVVLGSLHHLLQWTVAVFARVPPLFGPAAVTLAAMLLGAALFLRLRPAPSLEVT